jgi:hypothetical protein
MEWLLLAGAALVPIAAFIWWLKPWINEYDEIDD